MCLFFKTKTAYECLISDWSSDVCSSDLDEAFADPNEPEQQPREIAACAAPQCISGEREQRVHPNPRERDDPARQAGESVAIGIEGTDLGHPAALPHAGGGEAAALVPPGEQRPQQPDEPGHGDEHDGACPHGRTTVVEGQELLVQVELTEHRIN